MVGVADCQVRARKWKVWQKGANHSYDLACWGLSNGDCSNSSYHTKQISLFAWV